MRPYARRQLILDRILENDSVSIKELADEFGLTEMSLRRDLNVLAESGQISRIRGGATRARNTLTPRRYQDGEQRHAAAKGRIARVAAGLLDAADTVFFYSGSTVARVAESLSEERRDHLTIITNSVPVVHTVTTWNDPHLVSVGGLYLPAYMAFVGPQAVESLRTMSADIAVVGCDGLTAAEGLTTPHQLVAEIGTVVVGRARRTIVVADSSKIGRRGFTPIAASSNVHTLVTDEDANRDEVDALREAGVEIIIA